MKEAAEVAPNYIKEKETAIQCIDRFRRGSDRRNIESSDFMPYKTDVSSFFKSPLWPDPLKGFSAKKINIAVEKVFDQRSITFGNTRCDGFRFKIVNGLPEFEVRKNGEEWKALEDSRLKTEEKRWMFGLFLTDRISVLASKVPYEPLN